jgi:hypothetical protein
MGLVFAAIILLWGMMNLLTWITMDRDPALSEDKGLASAQPAPPPDSELRAQAAAVAVAIALAEQQSSRAQVLSEPPTAIVSAWQLGMRMRQMYQKGESIRSRAR